MMNTDNTTTTRPGQATLACGHDVYITPSQAGAGQAFHCGHFRNITRLPGEAGEREHADPPALAPYGSSVTDEAGAARPRLAPLADAASHARRVLADYQQRMDSGTLLVPGARGDDNPFYQLGALAFVLEALLMSCTAEASL